MAYNLLKHLFGIDRGQADVAAIDAAWAAEEKNIEAIWIDFAETVEGKALQSMGVAPTLAGVVDLIEAQVPKALEAVGVPAATVTSMEASLNATYAIVAKYVPNFKF
jgi:O-succinylbenzoate synthase